MDFDAPPPQSPPPRLPGQNAVRDEPQIHTEDPEFDGDRVLSNSILFIMEFSWWIELNCAVPEGDIGRVLEIFKVRTTNVSFPIEILPSKDFYFHFRGDCKPKLHAVYARSLCPSPIRVLPGAQAYALEQLSF
jgi:hypothetical protein